MNTHIEYRYRDGGNYKLFHEVILSGEVTFEQIQEHFYEGEFFVPSEVGLEDLQEPPYRECDHVWHEIASVIPTEKAPTVDLAASEFLARFALAGNARWTTESVMARMMEFA